MTDLLDFYDEENCTWCGRLGVRYTITLDPNPFDPVLRKEGSKTAMICAECAASIVFDEPARVDVSEPMPKPKLRLVK